jgi:putative hydrolase of HD superfamily
MTPAIRLADLILRFGRVNRATYHPDGERPESDTDHTVMLAVLACAVAADHPELHMDIGRVAQFALVHDLVEAHAGDTQSFDIGATEALSKAGRERAAYERIRADFRQAMPWIHETIARYEAQADPEARFVRYLDKVCPKLTHALNGGEAFRKMGKTVGEVRIVHDRQIKALAAEYPEFERVVGAMLEAACDDSEQAYRLAGGGL